MGWAEEKELRKKARQLRNNMTKAEIILWSRLRSKQVDGYKFRRQQPVFEYIADFYCHELKLIIEVDGGIHTLPEVYKSDIYRDKILKLNGYHVIRFENYEIETEIKESVERIRSLIAKIRSPIRGTTEGHHNEQH